METAQDLGKARDPLAGPIGSYPAGQIIGTEVAVIRCSLQSLYDLAVTDWLVSWLRLASGAGLGYRYGAGDRTAADCAFGRTDPNDSVSVTSPGRCPSAQSNSMRSRREPRVIHPICSPCRRTSSLSAIRSAISGGRVTGIECHAESDAERFQSAQQTGDVHRTAAGFQPVEIEPVIGVCLRALLL